MRKTTRAWCWAAVGVLAVGGIAYAAGREGERMEASPHATELLADLASAAERIEPHSPILETLAAGDLKAAREQLSFQPLAEAPVPEGFPSYTPVGVIEVKRYPAYRKAVGPGFWPLFQHIQTQGIPMTAPVEMTSETGQRGDGEMAFLYETTTVGELGPIDGVEVEQTGETLVASLGVRGRLNEALADEARGRLEAWLAEQSEYQRVAEGNEAFRLFGYNSPMVADSEKYWEAQMVLTEVLEQEAPE